MLLSCLPTAAQSSEWLLQVQLREKRTRVSGPISTGILRYNAHGDKIIQLQIYCARTY